MTIFCLFWELINIFPAGGPWSPFENNWHLREDYKKVNKRKELAEILSKHILWVSIINLVLCPVILLWQILHSFFTYAEVSALLGKQTMYLCVIKIYFTDDQTRARKFRFALLVPTRPSVSSSFQRTRSRTQRQTEPGIQTCFEVHEHLYISHYDRHC